MTAPSKKFEILVLNNIAACGLTQFDSQHYLLNTQTSPTADAILLRSFDLHDFSFPSTVQVVGRAGAGTNNIPIDHLTQRGIPVLNTPGANANAVKELVITGLLLASRNIYPALRYIQEIEGDNDSLHQQIEQNKKQFSGFELPGKTLGIIGLGKIGVKVANAAIALGMKVIGYDPAITVRSAWELAAEVQQAESLKDVLAHSDFVSLHVPLNQHTENLLNTEKIALMKPGAVLLNFARAEIVNNTAVLAALNEKKIKNYLCDFPSTIFKNHPQVICLPHLGASTQEAEENCAIMIVEQVRDFLENGHIQNSVNFPTIKLARNGGFRLAITNKNVPNMVAQISSVLSQANINIIDMINKSRDEIAYTMLDVNAPISAELLTKIRSIEGVINARLTL